MRKCVCVPQVDGAHLQAVSASIRAGHVVISAVVTSIAVFDDGSSPVVSSSHINFHKEHGDMERTLRTVRSCSNSAGMTVSNKVTNQVVIIQ